MEKVLDENLSEFERAKWGCNGRFRGWSMVEKPSSREEVRHSHECVAGAQETDTDLQRLVQSTSSLVQEQRPLLSSTGEIWCDISTGFARPVIPRQMRKTVFEAIISPAVHLK